MSNPFELPAIKAYRAYKSEVDSCHPEGVPHERQDIIEHLAKLKKANDEAYLKWLEMEVNPYGQ